jgi:hypothetical protein
MKVLKGILLLIPNYIARFFLYMQKLQANHQFFMDQDLKNKNKFLVRKTQGEITCNYVIPQIQNHFYLLGASRVLFALSSFANKAIS